jgi:hypothetical protein
MQGERDIGGGAWRLWRPPPGSVRTCAQARVGELARGSRRRGWVHLAATAPRRRYERHRPEHTTLYAVVRDNLETLYGAIGDGALDVKVSKHARKELEGYLDCGLLCSLLNRPHRPHRPHASSRPSPTTCARSTRSKSSARRIDKR